MSSAYLLRCLHARMADAELLFIHQSRATEEAFAESAYRWADERGRQFGRSHLAPQVELFPRVQAGLTRLTQGLRAAVRHGEQAESALARARGAAQETVATQSAAARLNAHAQQLAGIARSHSQSVEARAHSIGSGLAALGPPPI